MLTIEETVMELQRLINLNKDRDNINEAVEKAVKTMELAVDYLNIYKKALKLMANDFAYKSIDTLDDREQRVNDMVNHYIEKAKEEEE